MTRDDRQRTSGRREQRAAVAQQRAADDGDFRTPPRLRRAVSSKSASSIPWTRAQAHEDETALPRPPLVRRKSTPLPRSRHDASSMPSSASSYLATSPLAAVELYSGPVPFSSTLSSLLILLMPHSSKLTLPSLPASPPPSLSTVHALACFYSQLYPLLLTLHSNTASLALTHAHILDDVTHTLAALAAQHRAEQQADSDSSASEQRVAAAQAVWRQRRAELEREKRERDAELLQYVRERAADVEAEAQWAAERVSQQQRRAASEQRRVADEEREQRRLQRRIASMERRHEEAQRLSAESAERCQLLAQQTSAFSSQLALVAAALTAERSKSTQDEVELASARLAQQQQCMLGFRPRAALFRKPLLRDFHPQLRLLLPASALCLQASEVLRHTQCPQWAEWRVQVSAVGGSSSRWRLEVWDVDEGQDGRRAEERVCACWSSVDEVLLSAGEDVELRLSSGESVDEGEHVGTLWLSFVRMAYV